MQKWKRNLFVHLYDDRRINVRIKKPDKNSGIMINEDVQTFVRRNPVPVSVLFSPNQFRISAEIPQIRFYEYIDGRCFLSVPCSHQLNPIGSPAPSKGSSNR